MQIVISKLVPNTGHFAYILHDWQTSRYFSSIYNRSVPRSLYDPKDKLKDDAGYPEMCPLEPREGVKLSANLQWFWMGQLCLSAFGIFINNKDQFYAKLNTIQRNYITNAWLGLTKSWTAFMNGAGTEYESNRRNYITEWHIKSNEYPILFENTCGGSSVELFNHELYGKGYKVKTLRPDTYNLWKDFTFKTHPQYFTFASNSTVIRYGNYWRVEPFHYLDGKHVPVPLISNNGYVYVEANRVTLFTLDNFPKHYYPNP